MPTTTEAPALTPPRQARRRWARRWPTSGAGTMPIEYPGGGVVAEHTAVRERVGIFDVSHLGKARVTGPGAADFVNDCLTDDLAPDRPGPGAVHDVLQRDRRASSTTSSHYLRCRRTTSSSSRTPPTRRRSSSCSTAAARRRHHRREPARRLRRARGAGPAPPTRCCVASACRSSHDYMSFVETDLGGPARSSSAAPATPASAGTSSCPPWDVAGLGVGRARRSRRPGSGRPAGRSGRPRHLRTEMGYPLHGQRPRRSTSPRCRRGSAGRWAGASPGSAAVTPSPPSGPQAVPPDARARGDQPRHPSFALRRAGRHRCGRRRGHLGHLLAHPQAGVALALLDGR